MFMNCDESLLQYHFYSRSKDLLEMFKLGLNKLLQWNSISMVLFLIWLIIIKAIHNIDFTIIIVLAMQIASLWIFSLFIYLCNLLFFYEVASRRGLGCTFFYSSFVLIYHPSDCFCLLEGSSNFKSKVTKIAKEANISLIYEFYNEQIKV